MDWAEKIAAEKLKAILTYNPESGELRWKERTSEYFTDGKWTALDQCQRWNKKYAGKIVGCKASLGYIIFGIAGRLYKAHRVAWAIHYGEWPPEHIDHINRNTSDNRIANLRAVTRTENMRNRKMQSNNTSGITGVTWSKTRNVWAAKIGVSGRTVHLGEFKNLAEARAKRLDAEKSYKFSHFHGRSLASQIEKGQT